MISITDKTKCSGCHACANACAKDCIRMTSDDEGFWYPQVEKEMCIDCGLCENVCPIIHKWQPDESRKTTVMAAMNTNDEIRLKSSSGGIFTLLAEEILDQGGVVFGAAFSDDFKSVQHICVDNSDGLEKLRGSKYVQSKIGDTYKQAKEYLDSGRKVLFTGTPCQIGGLYSFLRKDYDNLYTQDIICHGVPSPMVWEKYVEERERKAASKTQRMFFRHKKYGWKTYAVLFEFSNNTAYVKNLHEDSFMRAFLSNSCLRPSCYDCSFKTIKRQADITLADFWGVWDTNPDFYDNKGTSVVLLHTLRGETLYKGIQSYIHDKPIDKKTVIRYNSAICKSVHSSDKRSDFMRMINDDSFDNAVKKCCALPLYKRILSIGKTRLKMLIKR